MVGKQLTYRQLPKQALNLGNQGRNPLPSLESYLCTMIRDYARGASESEAAFAAIPWVPRCVTGLTSISLKNDVVIRHIETCSEASFYTLLQNHENRKRFTDLAARLEPAVMRNGETLALYLAWASQMNFPLPRPIEEYRQSMIRDPLHGVRWALSMKDDAFSYDLFEWASAFSRENSAAAWVTCIAHRIDPEPFRLVLALNPMYACATAVSTGMKFAIDDFEAGLEPRDLFHLLANDALYDPHSGEIMLLQTDPLWGIEWLIESNKMGDDTRLNLLITGLRSWEDKNHPLSSIAGKSIEAILDEREGGSPVDDGGAPDDED